MPEGSSSSGFLHQLSSLLYEVPLVVCNSLSADEPPQAQQHDLESQIKARGS